MENAYKHKETPPRSARVMTFGELTSRHKSCGACRFCDAYHTKEGHYYSTRAFVCDDCIAARKGEKMPAVARAEKKAFAYARRADFKSEASFLAILSGVKREYAQWVLDQVRKEKAA